MTYLPRFAPQNPLLNGYPLGWSSCTAYSAQMAADYETLGAKRPTGEQIRRLTGDTTGGLTLAQVDEALLRGWDINLSTTYRLPWSSFASAIAAGKGAILQGLYAPIADSHFDAGRGFRGNHAIFVAPGWIGMDPLADGRAPGVYKFHGEAYPSYLLRLFAGKLNVGGATYKALGDGLVYASLTRDRTKDYVATVRPAGSKFTRHYVENGVDTKRRIFTTASGFQLRCTAPRSIPTAWGTRVSLVMITEGSYSGWWLSSGYSSEV